ncbi:MAG: VWA domain-containing protein [Acidobacteriaceae bacterium]
MNPARLFCVVLVFAATSLWAQQPAAAPATNPNGEVTRPSAITFTVEVTDKSGHPVSGLQQSDFTLLDNQSPVSIESFAAHVPGPASPETLVVAIDTVNMGFDGGSIARGQLMDFLRKLPGHLPYPMSLLLITDNGIQGVGKTSDDPKVLLADVNELSGNLRELPRSAGFWGATERQGMSVNELSLLARAAERMPGRKLVLWVGPGWPMFDNPGVIYTDPQLRKIFAEVVSLSNELTQAQMTLYDVDPLGGSDAGSFRTFAWEGYTAPVRRWDKSVAGNLALQVLAVQSGGLVLNSSNDVAGEVNTCAQDGAAWYTVTFVPQADEKPDTWHSVKVKLDKPGLIVRTRPGYYAQPAIIGHP